MFIRICEDGPDYRPDTVDFLARKQFLVQDDRAHGVAARNRLMVKVTARGVVAYGLFADSLPRRTCGHQERPMPSPSGPLLEEREVSCSLRAPHKGREDERPYHRCT